MRIPLTYYISINFKRRKNGKTWKSTDSMILSDAYRVINFFKDRYASIDIDRELDFENDDYEEDFYNIKLSFRNKVEEAEFILWMSSGT